MHMHFDPKCAQRLRRLFQSAFIDVNDANIGAGTRERAGGAFTQAGRGTGHERRPALHVASLHESQRRSAVFDALGLVQHSSLNDGGARPARVYGVLQNEFVHLVRGGIAAFHGRVDMSLDGHLGG